VLAAVGNATKEEGGQEMWSHGGLTDQIVRKVLIKARAKVRMSPQVEEKVSSLTRKWCHDLMDGPAPMKPLIEDGDGMFIEDAVLTYFEKNFTKVMTDCGEFQEESTELMPRRFKTLRGGHTL
jgi:hypothetical protein